MKKRLHYPPDNIKVENQMAAKKQESKMKSLMKQVAEIAGWEKSKFATTMWKVGNLTLRDKDLLHPIYSHIAHQTVRDVIPEEKKFKYIANLTEIMGNSFLKVIKQFDLTFNATNEEIYSALVKTVDK